LLHPDVIVKGGDYAPDPVVGAREVRARGGDVVIIPLTPGHSTTSTIDRLRAR
jgi:D-beta-D-heptose 7-phosphate kinase/D-beta-D-heptose 1-phosphate adenosyltransferase